MRRTVIAAIVLAGIATLATLAPASAGDPPYLKLAQALGTPSLANAKGPKDKSLLLLNFVRQGETYARWTKMTTVSILHVPAADTQTATRGVINRLRARLTASRVTVQTFDVNAAAPVTSYFEFHSAKESDSGIVYSPHAGFVTVAQLGVRGGAKIAPSDTEKLKNIIKK